MRQRQRPGDRRYHQNREAYVKSPAPGRVDEQLAQPTARKEPQKVEQHTHQQTDKRLSSLLPRGRSAQGETAQQGGEGGVGFDIRDTQHKPCAPGPVPRG